tara:strand:+ start:111807 stop:112208 length:402 start_codon:yes stop_codon:yes gene_type:complete
MMLHRVTAPRRLISLVSMIDVLLIMLVFFMVTSTYLHLDMIPVAKSADRTIETTSTTADGGTLLVRLGADGAAYVRGRQMSETDLASLVRATPGIAVTILPALRADTQALVRLMDILTAAGVDSLRILQVAAP